MSKGHSPFSKTTRILAKLLIFGVILGSYTNAFVFATVGNNVSYTMEFSENTVENMPANILDGFSPDTQAIIPSGTTNTPTRPGYKFAGWCDQPTTKSGNNDTCATGHSYQPGETYPLSSTTGSANKIKLYAMWTESMTFNKAFAAAGKSQSSGYYVMQDATSGICSAVDTGEIGEVKDSRDGTVYHIGKLADGKCWLLDNLALDLVTHKNNLSSANTNASDTTLNYLRNGGGSTSDKYATAGVSNWTSSYSYSAPLVNMTNKDVVPTSYNGTDDPMKDSVVAGNWKVGGYYNYCAASAGSYCYGNGTSQGTSSGNTTEDICPKGWRMPTGNTSGEYSALAYEIYGSTGSTSDATAYANYRSVLRLPLSGYFYDGSADYQGSYGDWWSSTRSSNYYMYRLGADASGIGPAGNYSRLSGYSVRCVLGS